MYLSARSQMLSDRYPFKDIVRIYKDAGYKGIEFCFEGKDFKTKVELLDENIIKYYSDIVKNAGMKVSAAGCHINCIDNDYNFEFIKRAVELTKHLDTDVFIITAACSHNAIATGKRDTEKAMARIHTLCDIAARYNITIALEPEPNHIYNSSKQVHDLIESLDVSNFGVNFDIGHSFLMDRDVYEGIDLLKEKIVHTHIENMYRGQHLHVLPQLGDMDLKGILEKLHSVGYDGALSLDLYDYDYEDACKVSAEYLKTILI